MAGTVTPRWGPRTPDFSPNRGIHAIFGIAGMEPQRSVMVSTLLSHGNLPRRRMVGRICCETRIIQYARETMIDAGKNHSPPGCRQAPMRRNRVASDSMSSCTSSHIGVRAWHPECHQATLAPRGDAGSFLAHFIGGELDDERLRDPAARLPGGRQHLPVDAGGPGHKGKRRARGIIVPLKTIKKMRLARDGIIIATGGRRRGSQVQHRVRHFRRPPTARTSSVPSGVPRPSGSGRLPAPSQRLHRRWPALPAPPLTTPSVSLIVSEDPTACVAMAATAGEGTRAGR